MDRDSLLAEELFFILLFQVGSEIQRFLISRIININYEGKWTGRKRMGLLSRGTQVAASSCWKGIFAPKTSVQTKYIS